MDTKTYRLPPAFWYDHHVSRGCSPTARVVRDTKSYVLVDLDQTAHDDLRSDCEFHIHQAAAGSFTFNAAGLVASAKATLRRLDADPMAETEDGHLGLPALLAEQEREFKAPVRRSYRFENPNPEARPRSTTVWATSEASARRAANADLSGSGDWPLDSARPL